MQKKVTEYFKVSQNKRLPPPQEEESIQDDELMNPRKNPKLEENQFSPPIVNTTLFLICKTLIAIKC